MGDEQGWDALGVIPHSEDFRARLATGSNLADIATRSGQPFMRCGEIIVSQVSPQIESLASGSWVFAEPVNDFQGQSTDAKE